ncbi:hypothetical protein GYMLUDRAFT_72567 [Collybiopsis luxurians FD-317 M1]|uniref:DNA breaking-rejoining enzyme n=1 Tax=Collybiopsis luxurians FD-317 M1 TaxID=944289 RepID=A0A0D0CJB8_9AGAR|nr:hypothetical protein GYMLUDRAFT_72567 [Collybiopsis luxurians FD-317 M1]
MISACRSLYHFARPINLGHLCPVRAYCEWINTTKITEGFVFRKIASNDRISADSTKHMTSEQFLHGFRMNLLDIGIDPAPYGTHSFCRGGCQWLATDLRWTIRKICEWGGWSTDFSYMTIVKYLISWNDDPRERREDFFNMHRAPTIACPACGRTCACS